MPGMNTRVRSERHLIPGELCCFVWSTAGRGDEAEDRTCTSREFLPDPDEHIWINIPSFTNWLLHLGHLKLNMQSSSADFPTQTTGSSLYAIDDCLWSKMFTHVLLKIDEQILVEFGKLLRACELLEIGDAEQVFFGWLA